MNLFILLGICYWKKYRKRSFVLFNLSDLGMHPHAPTVNSTLSPPPSCRCGVFFAVARRLTLAFHALSGKHARVEDEDEAVAGEYDQLQYHRWSEMGRRGEGPLDPAPSLGRALDSSEKLYSLFPFMFLQDKTMFSIPWKHAARHGWEIEKDANLFKLWAIHTGEKLVTRSTTPARTADGRL